MKYVNKVSIPDKVNWEYLKRFMICAECKNFTEAYEKIGTSRSALSNQLDSLEHDLGLELFERINHNRTLTLTKRGRLYYEIIKNINLLNYFYD